MPGTDILKTIFTKQTPLGPNSSTDPKQQELKKIFKAYFDTENFSYEQLQRDPTMIVGRKGSGKTDALLSHIVYNETNRREYNPIVFFDDKDASHTINMVVNQIAAAIKESYPGPMVEQIADFWTGLFHLTIFAAIFDRFEDDSAEMELIQAYLRQYGIKRGDANEPYGIFLKVIRSLRKEYKESDLADLNVGFFEGLREISLGQFSLSEAKFAADAWLRRNRKQALVLFDSVESIALRDPNYELAISGLLKAFGAFNGPMEYMSLRCCIPSESYFYLTAISSNTIKDFNRVMVLQWNSIELLRMAAKRMMTFLRLWYPADFRSYGDAFNVTERGGAIGFWKAILPDMVENRVDRRNEGTLTYLLRHTQLLPRQIIFLLNGIISRAIVEGGKSKRFPEISPALVVQEVARAEESIRGNIIESFKLIWPSADDALRAFFPQIKSNVVKYGDIHKAYNQSKAREYLKESSYVDMFRLLSELGVIGRLVKTTDRFHVAVFEYSEPHRLIYSPNDTLCIHPIYSSVYQLIDPHNPPEDFKPIYPHGIDPDGEDHRRSRSPLFDR